MAMITLRLKIGDKEGEVTLEDLRNVNYVAAKELLYEMLELPKDNKYDYSILGKFNADDKPAKSTN